MEPEEEFSRDTIQNFNISDIDDIIRNKKNLMYMFKLNRKVNRILHAT